MSPLAAVALTLVAFMLAERLHRLARCSPLVNPVLVAIALVVATLVAADIEYADYFDAAQMVHFLLGPATVALAVPLYRQIHKVRRSLAAVLVSVSVGGITAAASAVGLAWLAGADGEMLRTLAPKSVTTPIAIGLADTLGGIPSLAAAVVIVTGIVGAMLGGHLLDLLGVRDARARGLALGTAAHGIGTARAFQMDMQTGAFASLAMGLNGLLTTVLLPLAATWLG